MDSSKVVCLLSGDAETGASSWNLSLPCYYNRLIESRFFREPPYHPAAAAGKEKTCQLFPAGSPVLTFKFTNLESLFVINDVLGELIIIIFPAPGLKRNTSPLVCLMNVWR